MTVRVTRVDGDGPRELVLVREQLKVPSVEWFAADAGIGYVALSRFQEATTADLEAALRELDRGDVRVLILDLRDNPGGLVDQAVTVADLFIDRGTLVSIRGRAGMQPEVFVAHPERTVSRQRMIVLVDQDTASAAEIVASALQDHGRATIMGRSSHGKGSVQSFFDLADGSGLKLTTAYYYAPSGRALEHNGIVPDIEIEDFAADVIVAGPEASGPEGGGDLADGTTEAEPWAGHPAVPARLHDDHQFAVAYQTARAWLESKPGMPAAGPGKKSR